MPPHREVNSPLRIQTAALPFSNWRLPCPLGYGIVSGYEAPLEACPKRGGNSAVECQLPKLDVAGSIPVPRSIFSTVCTNRLHSALRLCSDHITCKLFSN